MVRARRYSNRIIKVLFYSFTLLSPISKTILNALRDLMNNGHLLSAISYRDDKQKIIHLDLEWRRDVIKNLSLHAGLITLARLRQLYNCLTCIETSFSSRLKPSPTSWQFARATCLTNTCRHVRSKLTQLPSVYMPVPHMYFVPYCLRTGYDLQT